ncbi:MAG: glycerol-3-phosphate 1-O-acyltransferase PlsY [Rhizobiales bacterium]|nr:glycerol-3-phosphate 1-O-acyltransferase PlsY [Hyphomicrobiales bacterium]
MSFDQPLLIYVIAALGGYMLGSIPFGLILTKLAGKGDVRDIGSGNIGATNVLRTGSKALAAGTLVCDMLKGLIPTLIAMQWGLDVAVVAGFCALVGHNWPVWLNFKGGKGVATYIGVLSGLHLPVAAVFCATWLMVALVFKISSLSALVAATLTPVAVFVLGVPALVVPLCITTIIIFWKHRENIQRLLRGEEAKINLRKS